MNNKYCEKVSNCIDLINTIPEYHKYKIEIINNITLDDLSDKCKAFIFSHQNKKENDKEIRAYINTHNSKERGNYGNNK